MVEANASAVVIAAMSAPSRPTARSPVRIRDPDAVPGDVHQAHVRASIERGRANVRVGRVRHTEAFLEKVEREPE